MTEPPHSGDPGLIPAMAANYAAFWATLDASPKMKVEYRPRGMRFTTGIPHPVMNGIMGAAIPGDDTAVKAEVDYFLRQGLPMSWTIGPGDTPADIGDRLLRIGLKQTSVNPGMIVDLDALDEERIPAGFEIIEVADEKSFRIFSRILCDAFELPVFDEFADMFIDAGTGEDGLIASFLGVLDGEPVATSRAILTDGLAGVYTVATSAAARGRGIGRAMTLAACLHGKPRGYHLGTLQASAMGHSVYLQMGFRDICEFRDYTWSRE